MSLQLALAFALGVHLLAFLSLGLVGDGTPQVRAYRWFVGAVSVWIILALLTASGIALVLTRPLAGVVAHFLPVVLLLGGTLSSRISGVRVGAVVIGTSALLLPFTVSASPWHAGIIETAYFVAAWSAVGIGVFAAMRRPTPTTQVVRWRALMLFLAVAAASIGWLVGVGALGAIALLSSLLAAVVLYATVRLSLCEVRAGATRTGDLAGQAAEHDRRAVAGEIAAMVAHEVRNPLTGVRSLAQRLADGSVDEARRRRYAELIVREVDRVERMVSALLGASGTRRAPPPRHVTDLNRLLEDVGLLVAERYKRAGVRLTIEPAPLRVVIPTEPVAQALLNLLINAAQQAPAVRHVRLMAQISDDGSLHLRVQDDGPGVAAESRESIFAPFHSGTGNSGLGLAVVRRICEELGWVIVVSEAPGGGAMFVLTIPEAAPRVEHSPSFSAAVKDGRTRPRTG